eukprot:m.22360 g.22360  ORF g.22360 m.22360 type:complete len:190 (-) comp13794_c0_seq1:267-836(-)
MGKRQSKLTEGKISELKTRTHFNEREINKWFKAFIKDCPTGALSRDEFIDIYAQFFPFGQSAPFASKVFDVFDVNEDGVLTFEEYLSALSVTARGTLDEKIEWVFKLYDVNRNGNVEVEELEAIVQAINEMVGIHTLDGDEDSPKVKAERIFNKIKRESKTSLSIADFDNVVKNDASIRHALTLYDGIV